MTAPAHRGRRDNGLVSETFSPVADVDPRLADHLLDVLGLRAIPAYVEPSPASNPVVADRLFVASNQTGAARAVVNDLADELGIEVARSGHPGPDRTSEQDLMAGPDLMQGIDTNAEFAAIIAGMPELDRPLSDSATAFFDDVPDAVRAFGHGGLVHTGSEVHDDVVEHFVPPPAPPLPRFSAGAVAAVLLVLLGIAIIAAGDLVGMPADLPLPLGVVFVLFGGTLLFLRLRDEPRDDSDDGAVV